MILRQTFEKPMQGYWDGGPKRIFDWAIDSTTPGLDNQGFYIRVGSWSANHHFYVSLGKTEKQTLANIRRKLTHLAKTRAEKCSFEYLGDLANARWTAIQQARAEMEAELLKDW